MASMQAAKRLIKKIWSENTMNGAINDPESALGGVITESLAVLYDQLYDKATHFLLELVQNADDNTYHVRTPTLNFTYEKGSLRVDCNEIGFSEHNVRAICKVGKSTKGGLEHSTSYIGEKGIGFKSVFKVATAVYISSGNFSFMFDRSAPAGLIAPTWADFPRPRMNGYTSFYLELSKDCDEENIVREIEQLDPRMLIFLRRLRQLNLSVTGSDGKKRTRCLRRQDEERSGTVTTTLYDGISSWRFVVTKHHVDQLPADNRRPGCSRSEIILAFPCLDCTKPPTSDTQSVYAFLPIRDYGLRFLLQGDFLLTASREEVVECPWNKALLRASVNGFVAAVEHLNSGSMKYCWLQYLPTQGISGFFAPLGELITGALAAKAVLESCDTKMRVSSSLVLVPLPSVSSSSGAPFTLNEQTQSRYLSMKYPKWAMDKLYSIGVKALDEGAFLDDLSRMTRNNHQKFRQNPEEWHSQLAGRLLSLAMKEEHKSAIMEMEVVPLQGGEWVSAKGRSIIFSRDAGGLRIPSTIPTNTIDTTAGNDPSRRMLFTHLGAKSCDAAAICRLIVRTHNDDAFDPQKLTVQQLREHVLFMFKSSFQFPVDSDLWFATNQDSRCRGSSLYMHGDFKSDIVLGKVTKVLTNHYSFIHPDYETALPKNKKWLPWLRNSFRLSIIPRITPYNPVPQMVAGLSNEFKHIFRVCSSQDVLLLLCDHWVDYAPWIDGACASVSIREAISSVKVETQGGLIPLRDTLLPGVDPRVDGCKHAPVLTLKSGNSSKWAKLEVFGVATQRNAKYFLQFLKALREHCPSKKLVGHIYCEIQTLYNHNEVLIWDSFRDNALVYTHSAPHKHPRWLSTEECIKTNLPIEKEYRGSASLFRCLLASDSGEISQLITAATKISLSTSLTAIVDYFTKISQALSTLSEEQASSAIQPLLKRKLLPLVNNENCREFDALAKPAALWFVADRQYLRDSFLGEVPLLAFPVAKLGVLEEILKIFGHEERLLSKLVKSATVPIGRTECDGEYTSYLTTKAPYLTALIPKSKPDRERITRQIVGITANRAEKIVRKDSFEFRGQAYTGKPGAGEVAYSQYGDHLNLYMTDENIDSSSPPLELVKIIVKHCGINMETHMQLVHLALSETMFRRLRATFRSEGIHIAETADEIEADRRRASSKYAATESNHPVVTSAFGWETDGTDDDSENDNFHNVSVTKKPSKKQCRFDRRLPLRAFKDARSRHSPINSDTTVDSVFAEFAHEPFNISQYYGELMTSKYLQRHLGQAFDPEQHWTSFGHHKTEYAAFTIADIGATRAVCEFLSRNGFPTAIEWLEETLSFHFEVVVTRNSDNSLFFCNTGQFERMRRFRISENLRGCPKDMSILVRIREVYTEPLFDLFLDPWFLVVSGRFTVEGGSGFHARITSPVVSHNNAKFSATQGQPLIDNPMHSGDGGESQRGLLHDPLESAACEGMDMSTTIQLSAGNDLVYQRNFFSLSAPYSDSSDAGWHTTLRAASSPQDLPQPESAPSMPSPSRSTRCGPCAFQSQESGPQVSPVNITYGSWYHDPAQPSHIGLYPSIYSRPGGSVNRANPSPMSPTIFTSPDYGQHLMTPAYQVPVLRSILERTPPLSVQAACMDNESTYSYRSLDRDQIRLLHLYPGEDSWKLQGAIIPTSLDRPGYFQAVSYTWGETQHKCQLHTPEGLVKITNALFLALKALRHKARPLVLWVDAICIDQDNSKEKARQIRLLPHIFQRAIRVLAYVGPSQNNTLEVLAQIHVKESLRISGGQWPSDLREVPKDWKDRSIPPTNDLIWRDINDFFQRSWFQRAWIIQEVVAAASVKVIYGKWMMDWNDLFHSAEIISREVNTTGSSPSSQGPSLPSWNRFITLAKQRELEAQGQRSSLLKLLETFQYTKSTLQQDRFFCLLGLATDGNSQNFVVDYELPAEEVSLLYAEAFILQGMGPALLHRAGIGYRLGNLSHPRTLPSWIPDWTGEKQGSLTVLKSRGMPCAASKKTESFLEHEPGTNELHVQGIMADKIRTTSTAKNTPEELLEYLTEIETAMSRIQIENADELKWRVPIAAVRYPSVVAAQETDLQVSYEALKTHLSKKADSQSDSWNAPEDSLWMKGRNYFTALQDNLSGWRFVTTARKLVGVAPPETKPGDFISVFDGCEVPFIVRYTDPNFHLIGECYVHGLMNGEASSLNETVEGKITLT